MITKKPYDDQIKMTIRLDPEFHAACSASADEVGQTLSEWIRRAMKDKLDRINQINNVYPRSASPSSSISESDREIIRAVIREELEKIELESFGRPL